MRPFSGQAWPRTVPCVSRKARRVSPQAPTLSHKARMPPLKGACTAQADATRVVKSEDARAFCDRLAALRGERAPWRGEAGAFSGKRGGSELVERAEHAAAAAVHGWHVAIHREVAEEGLDLGGVHVPRVAFAVVEDETACPIDIHLLGADGVMQRAQAGAKLVEQAGWRGRVGCCGQGGVHGRRGRSFLGCLMRAAADTAWGLTGMLPLEMGAVFAHEDDRFRPTSRVEWGGSKYS